MFNKNKTKYYFQNPNKIIIKSDADIFQYCLNTIHCNAFYRKLVFLFGKEIYYKTEIDEIIITRTFLGKTYFMDNVEKEDIIK